MAAARYTWMFRAAALVFVLLGLSWLWTFGFTAYHPEQRPYGLAAGVLAVVIGVFLFRRAKFAIAISALAAIVIAVAAMLFIPLAQGPGVLFLVALAVVLAVYATLAARALFTTGTPAA
jgi:hypothetical protein